MTVTTWRPQTVGHLQRICLLKVELQKKSPSEQVTAALVNAEDVNRGDCSANGEEPMNLKCLKKAGTLELTD